MRHRLRPRPEYAEAFRELIERIAKVLPLKRNSLPVMMYVAGGAALHFYTGERVSKDIDASFSRRVALPENLEVTYRDADGAARMLYFDRQYTDTLSLLHEDAYEDAEPLELTGIDPSILEVRLLSPLDLAVSKISRFADQDRDDIAALARDKLVAADSLRRRAQEAVKAYVGDTARIQSSIELACRIVKDAEGRGGSKKR